MSLLITRRPEKRSLPSSPKLSRWTALANPYIFEITRADHAVLTVAILPAYHPTFPTISTNGAPGNIMQYVAAGDNIYLKSAMYNGIYSVHSVLGSFITINTPYIGVGGNGRVNLIDKVTNYKVYTQIYDATSEVLIDTIYGKPDNTGLLMCDVSGAIRSTVKTKAVVAQSVINRANKGISGGFHIAYGATYTIETNAGVVSEGSIARVPSIESKARIRYYWAAAARQVDGFVFLGISGAIGGNGQNINEYVPKNLANKHAKFLTMFDRPTYFEGFPFFLSFIYDEDFKNIYLNRHQQDTNVNGASVGAVTVTTLLNSEINFVNQMNIRAVNGGSAGLDVWLETGAAVTGGGLVTVGGIASGFASRFAAPYVAVSG